MESIMWTSTCCYCGKEIKDQEPCYPVYENREKKYRHVNCYPPEKEKSFGEVTDLDGELD